MDDLNNAFGDILRACQDYNAGQIQMVVRDENESPIMGVFATVEPELATFDLDGVETGEHSKGGKEIGTTYFQPAIWPPAPPQVGERITICGFPSKSKIKAGEKWYYVTCTMGAQEIHGVNEDTFTIQFERNLWYYIGGEIDSQVPQDIGGVSSGLVFLLNNLTVGTKIFSISLIGINQEHHECWDIMYVSRLDKIDALGRISKK